LNRGQSGISSDFFRGPDDGANAIASRSELSRDVTANKS
jgi:hypothetical protein